jgi:hypothetical protein
MVVKDRHGATVGVINQINLTRDSQPAVQPDVDGTRFKVPITDFRVSHGGDQAVISLTKSEIRTSQMLNGDWRPAAESDPAIGLSVITRLRRVRSPKHRPMSLTGAQRPPWDSLMDLERSAGVQPGALPTGSINLRQFLKARFGDRLAVAALPHQPKRRRGPGMGDVDPSVSGLCMALGKQPERLDLRSGGARHCTPSDAEL